MPELNRLIHEPSRLVIVTILANVKEADFTYLLHATDLTKGNLSAHLAKLEAAKYIEIEKSYRGKRPLTLIHISQMGKNALHQYRKQLTFLLTQTG